MAFPGYPGTVVPETIKHVNSHNQH